VTPETILYRWKKAIKNYWTFDKQKTRKQGRPPDISDRIKKMPILYGLHNHITEPAKLI
jgi:hypothetical protein